MSDAIGTDYARTSVARQQPVQPETAKVDGAKAERPTATPDEQRDAVAGEAPRIEAAAKAAKDATPPVRDPAMPAAADDTSSLYAPDGAQAANDDAAKPDAQPSPWNRAVDDVMADRMGGRETGGRENWRALQDAWSRLSREQRAQLAPRDDPTRMQRLLAGGVDPALGAPNATHADMKQRGGAPSQDLETALRQTSDPAEAARRLADLAGVDPGAIQLRASAWRSIAARADQIAFQDSASAGNTAYSAGRSGGTRRR